MRTSSRLASLLAAVTLVALPACGGSKADPTMASLDPRPLFDRLGGIPGITAVVDAFVETTGKDPRIMQFFVNADIPRLKQLMVDQICAATGGPCEYKGKDMKTAHTNMKIGEADFAAFIDDLTQTLDNAHVGARERGEVLAAFDAMKPDVVQPAP